MTSCILGNACAVSCVQHCRKCNFVSLLKDAYNLLSPCGKVRALCERVLRCNPYSPRWYCRYMLRMGLGNFFGRVVVATGSKELAVERQRSHSTSLWRDAVGSCERANGILNMSAILGLQNYLMHSKYCRVSSRFQRCWVPEKSKCVQAPNCSFTVYIARKMANGGVDYGLVDWSKLQSWAELLIVKDSSSGESKPLGKEEAKQFVVALQHVFNSSEFRSAYCSYDNSCPERPCSAGKVYCSISPKQFLKAMTSTLLCLGKTPSGEASLLPDLLRHKQCFSTGDQDILMKLVGEKIKKSGMIVSIFCS